jgi:hypothetical protein
MIAVRRAELRSGLVLGKTALSLPPVSLDTLYQLEFGPGRKNHKEPLSVE